LFKAAKGERELTRLGASRQDTMGFTVVSENTFLGSGHPGPREEQPDPLGLMVSDDAAPSRGGGRGRSVPVARSRLAVEGDQGAPAGLLARPRSGTRTVYLAAANGDVHRGEAARRWRRVGKLGGRPVAMTAHRREIYVALEDGTVEVSRDGGRSWSLRATPPA